MEISLTLDYRRIAEFDNMEKFVKFYGLLCSTLNIKEINFSTHNDGSLSVRIITLESVLKVIEYEIDPNI